MSHNVETMAYFGEVPWHGLGVKVDQALTSEEMLVKAGLDWDVSKKPVFAQGIEEPVFGHSAIVRDSDQKVLSIMSDEYEPHAPREAFKFLDTIVGGKYAMFHTAGSLRGGRKIWVLAQLPGDIRVKGTDDVVKKFVLFATSFDGSLATVAKLTPVRVVCENTLNEASRGAGECVKIRHSSTLESRVAETQRVLGIVQKQYAAFEGAVQKFAAARFSEKQMKGLVAELFPVGEADKVSTKAESARAILLNLFENGRGQEMCRGTAWAAYNAVTEFVDHHRDTRLTKYAASKVDQKADSLLFGTGAKMKAEAFQLIDEVIEASVPGVKFA